MKRRNLREEAIMGYILLGMATLAIVVIFAMGIAVGTFTPQNPIAIAAISGIIGIILLIIYKKKYKYFFEDKMTVMQFALQLGVIVGFATMATMILGTVLGLII